MTKLEQSKQEIKKLEEQKDLLLQEIDTLEKKLLEVRTVVVNGKIKLQCGTQVNITPEFQLILDPRNHMSWGAIFAILETPEQLRGDRMNNNNELRLSHTSYNLTPEYHVIPLWERWGQRQLD